VGVTVQVANEVRIDIEVRKEQQAKQKLKAVGDQAEKTGDQLEDMGDQATAAGKSTEKAGDKFKDTAKDTGHLRREIETTTARVKDLIEQFDRTGDTSLFKDIRSAKRDLGRATGFAKLIADPVADAGKAAGTSLISGLAEAFKTGSAALKGAAAPVLAGVVIAATPAIGAAIGAAVLTGVGAAGIGAGIAAAAQDPQVQEAAIGLGESLKEAFAQSASGFTAPLLGAFEILGDAGRQFAAQLNLSTLAPLVTTLAKGFAGLGQNLLPGLNKALEASKPLLRVLANELPEIGSALSDFFSSISEESDGATMFLASLLRGLEGTIRTAGDVISFLSGIYEWTVKATAEITGFLEDALAWIPWLGAIFEDGNDYTEGLLSALERGKDASNDFAGGIKVMGESAETTAEKVKALKDGINDLFDVTMGVEQANLSWRKGLLNLHDELTKGSRSLSAYSEAGIQNREALLSRVQAAEAIRDADIAAGMAVDQANAKYKKNIDTLQALALKEGFAKGELDKFIATWRSIPDEATKKFRFQVEVTGGTTLGAAMFRSQERRAEEAAGKRASGGPVTGGKTYWVGENGPELVTMGADGYVHNAAQSKAMTSGASGGMSMVSAGGGVPQIVVTVVGGDKLTQAVAESLRFEVRTTANGDPVEYFS
jgi:hypothetical protein